MNKILITGLALSNLGGDDTCNICNYDYSWIFNHPSVLLWSDKIILTPYVKSIIDECKYPDPKGPLPKAIKILFDILDTSNLLEVNEANDIISSEGAQQISDQVDNDRKLLAKEFPSIIKLGEGDKVPGQLFIGTNEYCHVRIYAIYMALLLARTWQASCLFNPADYEYLRFRLGIQNIPKKTTKRYIESFSMIFRSFLPDLPLIPHYAYGSECTSCKHEIKCAESYLNDLEKNTFEMIKWRDYEEIIQLKEVIKNIVNKYNTSDGIDPSEVYRSFQEKEIKMNKLINKVFPKIKRWTNLIAFTSIPFAVAGLAASNSLLTLSGAAFAGGAKMTSEILKLIESKNRWVGFINTRSLKHNKNI